MSSVERARTLIPVVLSGGSGTRLWPMSRPDLPKQFLPLTGARTLFQETVLRARALRGASPPVVVCNHAHRFLVAQQLRDIDSNAQAIVLEPTGRNTAPAAAVAALIAQSSSRDVDPLLLVLPADHVISDSTAFAAAVEAAYEAAVNGYLVCFGVVPDRPETGYGYLLRGSDRGRWSNLERFVEKPDLETAESYVRSGRYLWNSGMFLFSAASFLRELRAHAAPIAAACEHSLRTAETDRDFVRLGAAFGDCISDSIDYAVMERTERAAVVPLEAGWSDVGSWLALHEVLAKDANGNAAAGDVVIDGCRNSYFLSTGRTIAAIGLDDVVVVETSDAVLVAARRHAQKVKQVADVVSARKRDNSD